MEQSGGKQMDFTSMSALFHTGKVRKCQRCEELIKDSDFPSHDCLENFKSLVKELRWELSQLQ